MITKEDFAVAKIVKPNLEIKNPFIKWGKKKISQSSFNSWAESPANWIATYILGLRQQGSPRMNAGTVSESMTYKLLMGQINYDDIVKEAEKEFSSKNGILGTEDDRKAVLKDMIGYKTYGAKLKDGTKPVKNEYKGFIVNGYEGLKFLGKPIKYQSHVKYPLKYFGINADGWKDFSYKGYDVDMKTTGKMMSALPIAYVRQLAFYKMENESIEQRLLLCTKDKSQMYVLEDSFKEAKEEIYHILNTMAIALTECNSVEQLLERYDPDWAYYRLNQRQKDELRKHLANAHKISWKEKLEQSNFEKGIS